MSGDMPYGQKTAWTTLFLCVFFSPQLILQFTEGVQGLFQRKLQFPKEPEGSIIFQEGGPFFSRVGGPNANFYRNPYNL